MIRVRNGKNCRAPCCLLPLNLFFFRESESNSFDESFASIKKVFSSFPSDTYFVEAQADVSTKKNTTFFSNTKYVNYIFYNTKRFRRNASRCFHEKHNSRSNAYFIEAQTHVSMKITQRSFKTQGLSSKREQMFQRKTQLSNTFLNSTETAWLV